MKDELLMSKGLEFILTLGPIKGVENAKRS